MVINGGNNENENESNSSTNWNIQRSESRRHERSWRTCPARRLAQNVAAQTPITTTPIACSPAPCHPPAELGRARNQIFPEVDMVGLGGLPAGADVLVQVIGGNKLKGFARGKIQVGEDGPPTHVEVNHPGGVCWGAPQRRTLAPTTSFGSLTTTRTTTGTRSKSDFRGEDRRGRRVAHDEHHRDCPADRGKYGCRQGQGVDGGQLAAPLARLEVMIRNEAFDAKIGLGGRLKNDRLIATAAGTQNGLDTPSEVQPVH